MSPDLRPGPDSPPTDELSGAESALGALQHAVHPIARDELTKRTPCSEYDVGQLTAHLLNVITMAAGMAGAELPPVDTDASVEQQLVAAARPALDAWHRRGVDGTVTVGPDELPAALAPGFLAVEFLVHGWDYATATGHPIEVAESLAEYVLALAKKVMTPDRRSRMGFADPVDVPDDAPGIDRLVAFTGRDPAAGRDQTRSR